MPDDIMETLDDDDSSSSTSESSTSTSNKNDIERALKPRAYPLFLLEKGAQIIEDISATATTTSKNAKKERIVVLGTGWGAVGFLKAIDYAKYDVTVISPRNFFVFTPMLAGASVGTVEYRSITEPIRQVNTKINYLEATASSIDIDNNVVSCDSVVCEGNSCSINSFDVEYDRLLLSVGGTYIYTTYLLGLGLTLILHKYTL